MKNFLGRISKFLYIWLIIIFLFGLSIMTSYVFVQQEGRSSIDVPLLQQIQSAEADLKAGVNPSVVLKGRQIDLSVNQGPFITLYSLDKKVIGSSQHLSGSTLTLPMGVLENTRIHGQTRVTWQPTEKLRFASITDYLPTFGFVSAAQSLQETENRATRNMWLALVALGLGATTSGMGLFFYSRWCRRN